MLIYTYMHCELNVSFQSVVLFNIAVSVDSRWSIALMVCKALLFIFPDNGRLSKAFSTNKCMLMHSDGYTISTM